MKQRFTDDCLEEVGNESSALESHIQDGGTTRGEE